MKWIIRHRAPFLLLIDLISFQGAFFIIFYFRFTSGFFDNPIEPSGRLKFLMNIALTTYWLLVFLFRGMYVKNQSTSRYDAFLEVLKSTIVGLVLIFIFSLDLNQFITPTKIVLLLYGLIIIVLSSAFRILFRNLIRYCFRKNIGRYKSIIVGFGPKGQNLFDTLEGTREFGYQVKGIVRYAETDPVHTEIPSVPLEKLEQFLEESDDPIEFVLIALEKSGGKSILQILDRVARYQVGIMTIPDFYQILIGLARSQQLYGVPLIEIFPNLLSPFARVVKRTMDLLAATFVLVLGFPFIILISIAIAIDSKGPVFYRQRRVGYRGREFTLYKFRTMIENAEEETGAIWASKNDPRVTRIGALLRTSRLDELPQAWNVLKGEMSLVGPRPERKYFVDTFSKSIPFYARRLNVKPGITGWAQIRRGYDTSLQDVIEKLQYDLFYLENISLSLDIKILTHTLWVMFSAKGW